MQDGKNVPADTFIVYERIMYSFFFALVRILFSY